VRREREEYETPVVVNPAGPWAARVSRLAGVELPLELMMADLIVDGKSSTLDIAPFRLARFAEGALFQATYGGNRG